MIRRPSILAVAVLAAAGTLPAPAHAASLITESFDALTGSLSTRVDETGIPADLKGFTHTPPPGWSVDLAPGMPKGVTEWQGWSFTTLPFWTAAEGQGRDGFTRSSGVFAVADPDEWDDKDSPASKGPYDSALTSKPIDLPAGKDKVHLGFASHYRQESPQRAQVTVSFDGGAPVKVLSLGPDATDANKGGDAVNEFYSLPVGVPPGARTMKVAWRLYDARNNWYWAIDDVKVADEPIPIPPKPEPPSEVPDGPDGTKTDKVLVLGLDGTMIDKVRAAEAPNLQALMRTGLTAPSSLYTAPMAQTSSGPGWSTIATGVWPDKHGVKDNSFAGKNYDAYPDFLTRLEQKDPAFSTFAVSSWDPITSAGGGGPIYSGKADVRLTAGPDYDEGTTRKAAKYIRDNSPDATFVQLDNIDGAGHSKGPDSPEYMAAIKTVDGQVGRILDAVRSRPSYAQENWLIMVTADHGHKTGGGHGGSDPRERETFVIAQARGIQAGSTRTGVRLVDLAATALQHEGVAIDPAWRLDGRPLRTASADPFDTVRPKLTDRADETGIPAGIKGFTHSAPAGWSIDNRAMGTGGVTEWRGWSFTTDQFWTRAERDQRRETFVRGRDVIAVADSDEWADAAHTGGFDSTLVSPAYPVYEGGTLDLHYATHYRADPGQRAEVSVSFDGGAPIVVKRHIADAQAGNESVTADVPAGAKTAQVRFRYAATGDNWFWALDEVQVGSRPGNGVVVSKLTASSSPVGASKAWRASAIVTVTDLTGRPVRDVLVKGAWNRGGKPAPLPGLCLTRSDGTCELNRITLTTDTASLEVTSLRHSTLPYFREGDVIRTVTVRRP